MAERKDPTDLFLQTLAGGFTGEALFDRVPDTVYFLKDAGGRYMAVNDTLVARCGYRRKGEVIGLTAREAFPAPLGDQIAEQDRKVLSEGRSFQAKLELHLYPERREGWCLTWKVPLRGSDGTVAGLVGISRDLRPHGGGSADVDKVSAVLDHIEGHLDRPLRQRDLARIAGLSAYQLDVRIKALFGVSAGQYVTRARIQRACDLLRRTRTPISQVALDCGYGDQAAFSRQFRQSVGLTPAQYRSGVR